MEFGIICEFLELFLDNSGKNNYNVSSRYGPESILDLAGCAGGRETTMSEVHVKENESLESALKRFKRSCAKAGVIAEVKKREHYVSPSLKRKQKSEAARKNKRKFY